MDLYLVSDRTDRPSISGWNTGNFKISTDQNNHFVIFNKCSTLLQLG